MRLVTHPTTSRGPVQAIDVMVTRSGASLQLAFTLRGDLSAVCIPQRQAASRAGELWQHTCCEAFLMAEEGYYEFNLSPSSRWAAYRFDAYRAGMRDAELPAPAISWQAGEGRGTLTATLPLPSDATGQLALAAVIEAGDGGKFYWALAHPPGRPDFHSPACFAAQLPPAH